jgi:hypothetical protein
LQDLKKTNDILRASVRDGVVGIELRHRFDGFVEVYLSAVQKVPICCGHLVDMIKKLKCVYHESSRED